MAMTKKERAEFDAAIKRVNTLAALRWTEPVEKDIPIPKSFDGHTSGFEINSHSLIVSEAWSGSASHGSGAKRSESYCASQGGRELYSTRILALRGLRNEVERESAKKLREIDEMIEQERQK